MAVTIRDFPAAGIYPDTPPVVLESGVYFADVYREPGETRRVRIFRTRDGGATWDVLTELPAASFEGEYNANPMWWDFRASGAKIFGAGNHYYSSSVNRLVGPVYDVAGDTWSVAESGPLGSLMDLTSGGKNPVVIAGPSIAAAYLTGYWTEDGWARVYRSAHNGSAWTQIQGDESTTGMLIDPGEQDCEAAGGMLGDGIEHVFLTSIDYPYPALLGDPASSLRLWHAAVNHSTGALLSSGEITSPAFDKVYGARILGDGAYCAATKELAIPMVREDGSLAMLTATSEASPTWTGEQVSTDPMLDWDLQTGSAGHYPAAAVFVGETLHVLWVKGRTQADAHQLWRRERNADRTWRPAELVADFSLIADRNYISAPRASAGGDGASILATLNYYKTANGTFSGTVLLTIPLGAESGARYRPTVI